MLLSLSDETAVAFRVNVELGRLYRKRQRLDKALEHYTIAASCGEATAELHVESGQVLFQLECFDAAVTAFESAVGLRPTDAFALNCLAVTYSTLGKFDEANVSFRSAIEIDPDNDEYRNNLGLNYSHQKKYAAAADCFRHAIRINDNETTYHVRLARVLAAAKKNHEALSAITRCLEREPMNPEALVLSGDFLSHLRRFEDAIEQYDRAVTIQPDGNLYRKMGRIRLRLTQSRLAKECFMHAARIEPDSVLNYTCMGFVALLEGQLDHAMRLFAQAVTMDPICDEAYLGLSKTMTELGDFEEAESAIKTAIHCSPNNVEALVHYAYIREKFLDVKTAIRCYRRAIALDPANVEALLRCARVLHTADERTEAIELARKVLEWNAHSADAHYLLAELYIEEGRLALGLIHTRELFALQPEEKRRFINIAMSLERAKAMDKAIDVYKRITDTDAEYAEAYYHIGRLAYEGGLLKLSMEMQETLDRVSPEFARLLKKFRDQSLPAVDIVYIEGSSSGLVPVA
ncbi:MAG: tetratricopeptide repeat protein [Candidatus Kapaibacterium sp.]